MVKKLTYLIASVFIFSCNGQNNNKKNMLDIQYLEKHGTLSYVSYNGALSTTAEDHNKGVKHYELSETKNGVKTYIDGDEEIGFNKIVENNEFTEFTEYDNKGIPKVELKTSVFGYIISKIEFDVDGNISKEINFENLFKFKSDNLFRYMRSNSFDLDKNHYKEISKSEIPQPKIIRGYSDEFKFLIPELNLKNKLIWIILNIEGKYKNTEGIFFICLDGSSGKELLVKKYLGKKSGKNGIGTYANYETIFPK
ncbi:hypothetical protein FNJ88_03965 [Chryseobacterium sp. SNU WT5]|uniref:hypothetical protein n=1 Tax=Chryseobacterium sp. SNU WT5 TaxID=2594269 RepID=UPI00117D36F1|nr:hypothetical protein [Chryseobacterium sp. SNU WT5]QDP84747.1 hypothetical protein FNJ88_03965 [Chryseobacterium sp. SNU WT5]